MSPPKKGKKELTKTQIYSLPSSSLSKAVQLTFYFSKYCLVAAKHASIFLTHLFYVVSNSFGIHPKIIWVSWITRASVLKFQPHSWPSIILKKNPASKKFWSFPPDMIKESFQLPSCNTPYLLGSVFLEADMLIDHPLAIKEGD